MTNLSLLHTGEKNSHYGTCWITKDGISMIIKKELLLEYLNDGWTRGRKILDKTKIINANLDRIWIHKDDKSKFIYKNDLELFLNDFWEYGRVSHKSKKTNKSIHKDEVLVDIEGEPVYISKNDPRYISGELKSYYKGKVLVFDSNRNKIYVSVNDPKYLAGEYELVRKVPKGYIVVKDSNGVISRVKIDDPRYLSGELVHVSKGIKYSLESREKMRKHIKEYIDSLIGPFRCRYSKKACLYIDQLNEIYGWNLLHAENGGEISIGGYYPDGYDKSLNIVFEYDEKRHYKDIENNILKDKDIDRQNFIIEKLNCEFYRYNEKKNYFYRVH